jgi:YVTN family beta-propeller protein
MTRLLVLNKDEDTVSVVDADAGEIESTVETDFNPHEAIVTPDGSKTYVTCSLGGRVNVIDNDSFEVIERLDHEHFEFPHGLATRDGADEIWLAATRSSHLYVIDAASAEIRDVRRTHQNLSHMVALTPDESTAYVANIGSDNVTVVDAETHEIETHVPVGERPEGIGVHPDGEHLYVANQDDGTLSVLSTDDHEEVAELRLGTTPIRVVFSPDGEYALVPNRESDDVSVIDTAFERGGEVTPWEIARIPVGVWPGGTVVDAAGETAYVANNKTNDLSVLDLESLTEAGRIDVGIHPDGMVRLPEQ